MSALGFNCGKGRTYSEPARFARPIYKEETERVEVCLLKTGVVHLTAALSDAPANCACDAHHHEKRLARPRGSGSISNPQTDSSFMAKLLKIAKTKTVPPGQAAAFTIEGQKIALFNVEGTYYAIGDTCTHRGGPLSEGDVQGTRVTCPWHGADFDLKTGAVLGPPAQKGVPSYKVVVEGDDIKVEV
jgi:nitrite reductase (NADH) small subunit